MGISVFNLNQVEKSVFLEIDLFLLLSFYIFARRLRCEKEKKSFHP